MVKLRTVSVIMCAGLLVLPLAGCAKKVKLSMTKMCQGAGGTYVNGTCNPGQTNQKTAKQMCDAHGGWYMPSLDQCEVEGEP